MKIRIDRCRWSAAPGVFLGLCLLGAPLSSHAVMTANQVAETAQSAYEKMGFSAGVAAIYMFKDGSVENATVDSGNIIRVDKESRARTTAVLQAYYPIFNDTFAAGVSQEIGRAVAAGQTEIVTAPKPVVGIQALLELGSKDIIRSFGLGLVYSWRKYEIDASGRAKVVAPAFNIGIAAIIEPQVKRLGDGLVANAAMPAGDAIRFERKPGFGIAISFSAGF